jgi:hypothetical protein
MTPHDMELMLDHINKLKAKANTSGDSLDEKLIQALEADLRSRSEQRDDAADSSK